jgi:hypothetical protein
VLKWSSSKGANDGLRRREQQEKAKREEVKADDELNPNK